MLAATQYVLDLCENDRSQILIIEAPPGVGKTAYAANILAEVHSEPDSKAGNWDVKIFKKYMGFHPQHVLKKWSKANNEKVFLWDDAGGWLNALDYNTSFLKSFGKQMQTIRTKYHCVIFTCIDSEDLAKKIRVFNGAVNVRINLHGSEPRSPYISQRYKRHAVAKHWDKDWYDKQHRADDWEEYFCCYMPPVFYDWYQPIRKEYADTLTRYAYKEARKTREIAATSKWSEI